MDYTGAVIADGRKRREAIGMGECVCNAKKKRKCQYHAIYPDGRPYERLLSTPFLNALYQIDRENMQVLDDGAGKDVI